MRNSIWSSVAVLGICGLGGGALGIETAAFQTAHPTHVLVRFREGATAQQVSDALKAAGVGKTVTEYTIVPGLRCVEVSSGDVGGAIASLRGTATVMYAHADDVQSVADQTVPYGVTMVNAPAEWAAGGNTAQARGGGARVAILDTGFDFGHPDLLPPIDSASFTGEAVTDLNAHGTHCSGTVLAVDNTIGVIGVAPSADLLTAKVLTNGGWGYTSWIISGMQWAVDHGANVISMSLGGGGFEQAFQDAITAANTANVTVCAAAGNANSNALFYPAAYDGVIAVAAVDSSMARASFSNYGTYVSVCAPGVSVYSTIPTINFNATWNGVGHAANMLDGGAIATATANVYYCGIGDTAAAFPAQVAGNIAHIRRGTVTFQAKVINAENAGAIGVIISNNAPGNFTGTLNGSTDLPCIAISQADGDNLQANDGVQASITYTIGHGYAYFSGTSMACPHVAGVVGLIYANHPGVTPAQVKEALEQTALDLGDPGRDDYFGHGLVNAAAAVAYVPPACNADYNQDGGADTTDVIDLANDIASGNSSFPPSSPDFNSDGSADLTDVLDLANVIAGGSCP